MTKLVFFGSPQFSVGFLEDLIKYYDICLVVTGPDSAQAHQDNRQTAVKKFALKHSLNVISPERLDNDVVKQIRSTGANIGVVVAYGKILPESLIKSFTLGLINVHGSILPKYRGASPIETAILDGEAVTGPTIMLVEPALDSGPILASASFELSGLNQNQAFQQMASVGRPLLIESLSKYLAGGLKPTKQDDVAASFTTKHKKSDGLLNFRSSATQLERQIRAFSSWPTSYFDYHGTRLTIIEAEAVELNNNISVGQMFVTSRNLYLKCKSGVLLVKQILPAGKKQISGRDFANSHPEITRL